MDDDVFHFEEPHDLFVGVSPERARLAAEFGAAVRKTGSLMKLVGRAAADRVAINPTDLNCLSILSFSGRLTAGELARAAGLSTASITGVVDRLERVGYVRREREAKDRRRVVVHLVLDSGVVDTALLLLPTLREWQVLVAGYTDDELRLIVGFYGRMAQVLEDQADRLRGVGLGPRDISTPVGSGDPPTTSQHDDVTAITKADR